MTRDLGSINKNLGLHAHEVVSEHTTSQPTESVKPTATVQVTISLSVCEDQSAFLPASIIRSGSQGTLSVHQVLASGLSDSIDTTKMAFSAQDCSGQDMGAYILDVSELSAIMRDKMFSTDVKKPA